MKSTLNFSLSAAILCFTQIILAQSFTTTTTLPKDIKSGTNYSNCGAPGNKNVSFTVSGVGTLNTTTNQLAEINITLRSVGSPVKRNLSSLNCYIKSPSGTCVKIANRMGASNYVATNTNFDYKFRSPQACLNKDPDYTTGLIPGNNATEGSSGMLGVFSTTTDLGAAFNGENANGTWNIYFGHTGSGTNSFPDVTAAEVIFGEPEITDHSSDGNTCVSAVPWGGGPICLSTTGKTSDANSPGYSGGSYSGCAWNNSNDNNIWVEFTATSANTCLNISGTSADLQSIVVTDPNSDLDNNPCTPAGSGTYWDVASCPRSAPVIYNAVTGTSRSQNHCFTSVPGQVYYVVVDGNAGAMSDFYLTGISGITPLPVSLVSFTESCNDNRPNLFWTTATEHNNDYFTIERSTDGEDWTNVGTVRAIGNSTQSINYNWIDQSPLAQIAYYRLKQTDFDGHVEKLKIVASSCKNEGIIQVVPNPSNGNFAIHGLEDGDNVSIMNGLGQNVYTASAIANFMTVELSNLNNGIYFIQIQNTTKTKTVKMQLNK